MFTAFLGSLIARMNFPFAIAAFWLSLIPAAQFAWNALHFARKKEEVEIFHDLSGKEAFVIFNDEPGDLEFTEFVRKLKASISGAAKSEQLRRLCDA